MLKIKARQNGFTLLEVLISLLIVSIVMGEVMLLSSASQKAGLLGSQREEAYNLAMEQKELLRAKALGSADWATFIGGLGGNVGFSDQCVGSVPSGINVMSGDLCIKKVDGTKYAIKLDMLKEKPVGSAVSIDYYRKINIAVSWPNSVGQTEKVTMNYYVTKDRYIVGGGS